MANEIINAYGTQKTLEANGASISNNAIGQANDADYSNSDTNDFPDAIIAFSGAYSVAPTAGKSIDIIIRPLNFDSTNDAPSPSATYLQHKFGEFVPDASTSTQYLWCRVKDIPREGQVWLYNNATGQTISAGWTLKLTPVARKIA